MTKATPIRWTSQPGQRFANARTQCELLLEQTINLLAEATRCYEAPDHSLDAMRLEPRILLSATPIEPLPDAGAIVLMTSDPPMVATVSTNPATVQAKSQRVELVVIDPRLADAQRLLDDLSQRSQTATTFEILILDVHRNGVSQISEALRDHAGVDAVHIVSHGSEGRFLVGSTLLSSENFAQHAAELSTWQLYLSGDADVLIYGCDVAATTAGQSFLTRIADLTGADIAASVNATGASAYGGDWVLEYTTGDLETSDLFSPAIASQWSGLLQAITVTTTNDVVDGDTSSVAALLASRGADGFISLREAILAANQNSGNDVIFLSAGNYTLTITGTNEDAGATGDLDIRNDLEIYGAGVSSTTIDAAGIDRVFHVKGAFTVSINDLTIRGGNAGTNDGGGIFAENRDLDLSLNRVLVTSNTAIDGGGVYLKHGMLTIIDSTISNNSAESGGGLRNDGGDLVLQSAAILYNTASSKGGGINHDGGSSSLSLVNVTISGNSTPGQGGGIYTQESSTIVHSTIAYNTAASGGGIYKQSNKSSLIQNSILAINTGGNANTTLTGSLGHNLSDNTSSGLTHVTDIIVADPKLGSIGNYGGPTQTISLLSGSAAIDAGTATGVTQVDQRGFDRDVTADIGAFEYQRIAGSSELQVNSTTGNTQETSAESRGSQRAVAISSSGEYVVVWSSNQTTGADTNGFGALMRRYDANGMPLTAETQVNQFTTGNQRWASVAMDGAGNGIVVWTSSGQDGSGDGIYARRFDQTGAWIGNEFRVNTTTSGNQSNGVVAMNASGQFVVAWQGNGTGDSDGAFFRRFNAAGTALDTTEQLANGTNRGLEQSPSLAINDAGQFGIGWYVGDDLYIRHFAANGTAGFAEKLVDHGFTNAYSSAIGIDSGGRTIIVYRADGLSGVGQGVWGRGYNFDGSDAHAWFQVAASDATSPSIDMDSDGSFIVVWNQASDADGQAVMARKYDSGANPLGAAYRINATETGNQQMPSVAMLDTNNYVVVWSGESAGDSSGVVARQFGTTLPTNTAPVANNDSYNVDRFASIQVESYPDWFNQSWQYRQSLTVPMANGNVGLADYPVLVRLHASASDAVNIDYSKVQNAGQDLRFVDGDGNLLSYQIESWNSAGYSQVWVKVPYLETADAHNSFFMYYRNAIATDAQASSAVWDADYAAVYHLGGTANDSTSPSQNGTSTAITYNSGIVGQAATFDGTTSGINIGSDSSIDNIFAGGGSISAWIKPTGWGEGSDGRIADKASSTNGGDGFAFQVAGTAMDNNQLIFEYDFSGTIGRWRTPVGSISLNSWQFVVITYDNSSVSNVPTIYINGVQQVVTATSTPVGTAKSDAAQNLVIGNYSQSATRTFDGQIDELRISTAILDADWISQEYRSVVTAPTISAVRQSRPTGLLVNDTDADKDSLTVTLVSGPAHASTFNLNADGSFSYQHNGDTATSDSFVYQVSDGQGGVSTATANLSIQFTNTAPSISTITNRTINEDTSSGPIAFTIGDVETPAGSLTVIATSNNHTLIANGSITLAGSGVNRTISFTPQNNQSGSAVISVSVSDGTTTSTEAFNVTVNAVNDAPIAVTDSLTAATFGPTIIRQSVLLANDLDAEGDTLTFELVSGPSNGTLDLLLNGDLRYQQTAFAASSDSFSYRVSDGIAWSDPVVVTININSLSLAGFSATTQTNSGLSAPTVNTSNSDGDANSPNDSPSSSSQADQSPSLAVDQSLLAVLAGMTTTSARHSPVQLAGLTESEASFADGADTSSAAQLQGSILGFTSDTDSRADARVSSGGRPDVRLAMASSLVSYDLAPATIIQPQLWLALDSMKQDVASSLAMTGGITVGAAATTSVGMTVGYVVWVLRSGLLLSSVMAHLPMWRFMDPLAILDSNDAVDDDDQETLGSMVDGESNASSEEVPSEVALGGSV